jgi:hypothetical protein
VNKSIEFKIIIITLIDLICRAHVEKQFKNKNLTIFFQNSFKIIQKRKILSIKRNKKKLKWENVALINLLPYKHKKYA